MAVTSGSSANGQVLLDVRSVSQTFPGLKALDDVSLQVRSGQITAVVGHNGSGKSTLVKVLAGIYTSDSGSDPGVVHQHGETRASTGDRAEVHFIHQNPGLVDTLSAVENFGLGERHGWGGLRAVRRRAERHDVEEALRRFGARYDVTRPLRERSAPERAVLSIARAMHGWSHDRNVLVLDEPTEALHSSEVQVLFDAVRTVQARGAGIIFISHRIDEVLDLADRVVVLRDGRKVADVESGDLLRSDLVGFIAGTDLPTGERPARAVTGTRSEQTPRLRVRGLSGGAIKGMDLAVRAGEIVGVSGLLGSGREHLTGLIFGAVDGTGSIDVDGEAVTRRGARPSIRAGIAFVPGDRVRFGIVPAMSVVENVTLPRISHSRRLTGAIDRRREQAHVATLARQHDVRPGRVDLPISQLSGGNQQKAVLAKWLRTEPKVLLLDEPTQGVDIGAKATIYDAVRRAAGAGTAVLVSSSDTEELAALCDRVLVLRDGEIADELRGDRVTEQSILASTL